MYRSSLYDRASLKPAPLPGAGLCVACLAQNSRAAKAREESAMFALIFGGANVSL